LSQNITEDIMTMTYNDDALKWTHIVVEVALKSSPLNKATSVICLYGRPVVFWRISHTHTHTHTHNTLFSCRWSWHIR